MAIFGPIGSFTRQITGAIALVFGCSLFAGSAHAGEYTLIYGGPTLWNDINNNNVAVGQTFYFSYFGFTDVITATEWRNGVATDFSASLGKGYQQATATGINDNGVITGSTNFALPGTPGPLPTGAFRYDGSGPLQSATFLGSVQPGEFAAPQAINDTNVVVGSSGDIAFATAPGGLITAGSGLGTLGGPRSFAHAVNDADLVVGEADTTLFSLGQPAPHAFAYDTTMHDLGTLSAYTSATSTATGVNTSGAIVGYSDTSDPFVNREAFLHTGTGPLQASDGLGTLGGSQSYGLGINDQGEGVGSSGYDNSGRQHAFLYRNGQMLDLNTLVDLPPDFAGWELMSANGINDNGWIIGTMAFGQNVEFGFILAPAVPEPAAWALMILGLAGVGVVARRRRLTAEA